MVTRDVGFPGHGAAPGTVPGLGKCPPRPLSGMIAAMDRARFLVGSVALLAGGRVAAASAIGLAHPRLGGLASAVRGAVIAPPGPAYDGARGVYNERFDRVRPLAVVAP